MVYLAHFNRKPPAQKAIIRGQRRQHVIGRIIDILDDYRLSKFENEGAIRAALRSALCLQGHGWRPSDEESETLLATAFRKMGAKRPTWIEGQPEYITPRENCIRCGDALDDETMEKRGRFCSDVCRGSAAVYREAIDRYASRQVYSRSWYVVAQASAPERPCTMCGKAYRSAFPQQKFCSYDCSHAADRNPARRRQCARCNAAFVDHQCGSRPQRFCSTECRLAAWKPSSFTCCECGTEFEARHAARFCGAKCRNTSNYRREMESSPIAACAVCGDEFQSVRGARFCGKVCKRTSQANTLRDRATKRKVADMLPFGALSAAVFDQEFAMAA
jgi:predicted nucleic acid-binding Zn ribbon protein